jgi:putative aldouronate transport system substrate-binding protein
MGVNHQTSVLQRFSQVYPDKDYAESVTDIKFWPFKDGQVYHSQRPGYWSESYINANVSEAKFAKILELFDYLLSPDGRTLVRFGIEGVDYERAGDEIVILREPHPEHGLQPAGTKYPSAAYLSYLASWDEGFLYVNPAYDAGIRRNAQQSLDWWLTVAKPVPTNFTVNNIRVPAHDTFPGFNVGEVTARVMFGTRDPVAMWNEEVERALDNGLRQLIEQVNAEADQLGIRPQQ